MAARLDTWPDLRVELFHGRGEPWVVLFDRSDTTLLVNIAALGLSDVQDPGVHQAIVRVVNALIDRIALQPACRDGDLALCAADTVAGLGWHAHPPPAWTA